MTDNPSFPSPDPPLATVEAAIDALAEAETATATRGMETVTVRDEKRKALVMLLQYLRSYVQKIANADVDQAASIIESAGMAVKKPRVLPRRVFGAKPGRVSGSVDLVAPNAGHHASYQWAYSTDGMKTWVSLPPTVRSSTTVKGLEPASRVYFRYRTVTKDGVSDWSQPVWIIVD